MDTFGSADPYVCVSALDPSQTKVIHDHKAIEVETPVKQPARRCCGAHAHRLQPGLSGAEFSKISGLEHSPLLMLFWPFDHDASSSQNACTHIQNSQTTPMSQEQ